MGEKLVLIMILIAVTAMLIVAPNLRKISASPYVNVDVETAYNMITNGSYPDLVVLDVRTQSEYNSGHIYGAVWIPHTELEARISELAGHEDHEIIVYCRSGVRSVNASETLDSVNFTKVYNMLGGILAWESGGYPVWIATIHNLNTTFNYDTIQAAIDAPQTLYGHTIFVEEGTYYEHVVVNKSISLIGENKYNTIIDGNSAGTVVNITASNVKITNFIIRKSRSAYADCGIYLSSNANNISYNFITDNYLGIWLEDSSNNTISGNTITNNDDGIWLDYSSNNNIYKNNIANNIRGIKQDNSPNNAMYENNVTTNTFKNSFGIRLVGSSNGNISGNTFMNCGIIVDDSYSNVVENNTVNRKPLVYLEGISNHTVQEAGQVIAVNCRDIRANNLNLSDATVGVELWETNNSEIGNNSIFANSFCGVILEQSHNNDIWGNNITENSDAIRLGWFGGSSNNNTISGNSVVDNENGIYLGFSSNNNTISKNEIKKNYWDGIYVYSSSFNIIMGNNINGNRPGIYFTDSSDNVVFHNNFISNSGQVYTNSINFWDYGYPCEGNYWSDYNGTDANNDGIGDSYYVIDVNNTDHCPLMGMFSDFNATSEYYVQTICNSSISGLQFNGTAISFNVSGENGTTGSCRICIPTALMNGTYRVFVNRTEILPPPLPLPCSNSTHTYLYFTYHHSTQEVVIIPGFPSLVILPLFMIATLLAVTIYRRKHTI